MSLSTGHSKGTTASVLNLFTARRAFTIDYRKIKWDLEHNNGESDKGQVPPYIYRELPHQYGKHLLFKTMGLSVLNMLDLGKMVIVNTQRDDIRNKTYQDYS